MSPAASFFRISAFVALAILVRGLWLSRPRAAAVAFVAYLAAFACLREGLVWFICHREGVAPPFQPDPHLGHVGPINVVVVSGWVFTALLSLGLARMIQRRLFPEATLPLTLALAALVTTAVAYAVETTGTRLPLWEWNHPRLLSWLPFELPLDALEAWAGTSFFTLLIFETLRSRFFSARPGKNALWLALSLVPLVVAVAAEPWVGHSPPPYRPVFVLYMIVSSVAGLGRFGRSEARPAGDAGVAGEREVTLAAGILLTVLAAIDAVGVGRPRLLLSEVPLAILTLAAVARLTLVRVAVIAVGVLLSAIVLREWRALGLAYPLAPLGLLLAAEARRARALQPAR